MKNMKKKKMKKSGMPMKMSKKVMEAKKMNKMSSKDFAKNYMK